MMQHTPGPWLPYRYERGCYCDGVTQDGWTIEGPNMVPDYECPMFNEADANLIAAAPELLHACKTFYGAIRILNDGPDASDEAKANKMLVESFKLARDAILKAEGE